MTWAGHIRLTATTILAVLVAALALTMPGVSADGGDADDLALLQEKDELKYPNLGSALNDLVVRVENWEISEGEAAGETPVNRGKSVAVTVYLSGNVDGVVEFLAVNGGDPRNAGEDYIEAYVPVMLLGRLSQQPGVIRVREIVPPQPAQPVQQITGHGPPVHGSAVWNQSGYSGQGVKVGIIDDFRGFSSLMGTELPTSVEVRCYTDIGEFTRNLADCEAVPEVTGDDIPFPECLDEVQRRAIRSAVHGTAVAEAVIDIAPEASLYIANPGSRADLQAAVDWMVSEGVSVINYSVGWTFDGPGDGTSPLSVSPLNTVDRAVNRGALWVNAAGNDAQDTWFGNYSDPDGDEVIEFGGLNDEVLDIATRACRSYRVQLRWEDTWDGASTDLDLLLYHKSARRFLPIRSVEEQSGESGQVPFESLRFWSRIDSDDLGIVVHRSGGDAPGWIQLVIWGTGSIQHHTESGSITNPAESDNLGMLAVGAAHYWDTNAIASYSSRGPTPDGRFKPDIVGTACGETASYEHYLRDGQDCWFAGTSQAAPHVAGMAALVRQAFPDYTPGQVAAYLKDNAGQRGSPDPNNTWGHGFAVLPSPKVDCTETITGDGTVSGQWHSGCDSQERTGSHASYYTFSLAQSSEVTVTLESSDADTFLYLREGEARSDKALYENNDAETGNAAKSQIRETLAAGAYTIEATTYNAGQTGSFFLTVSGLGGTGTADLGPSYPPDLLTVASQRANGPGAIYVGDLEQLVGLAPETGLGGIDAAGRHDGRVPLESLERHDWIYKSPYYRELLDNARFTNPTPLSSSGEKIVIRHACINRALLPCRLLETFFVPNLAQRTGGQVEFEVTSFPELGMAGRDTLSLIADGTLDSATVYGGWVAGEIPAIDIQNLWGVYSSSELEFKGNQAIMGNIEDLVLSETGGVILNHSWLSGNDQYLFCKEPVATADDFNGRATRSHSTPLSDWIRGMGGQPLFIAFADVYTALERGIFDCAATGPDAAYGQRWYEVVSYMIGPLVSLPVLNNVVNGGVWESIPEDLQQIIMEEAAKSELEALRLASVQNETGVRKNELAGLINMPFSYDLKYQSRQAALNRVIPGWIGRVGDMRNPIFDVFNEKVSPIVDISILENGTVTSLRPTDGCGEILAADGTKTGTWASGCESSERPGSFARYYGFTLAGESEVTITLESADADTYLYLRRGGDTSGAALHKDDDYSGGGTDSQIRETLAAGSYTVEATTYHAGKTGSFTLTLSTSQPPGPSCFQPVKVGEMVRGEWTGDCASIGRAGSNARYYTFSLSEESDVVITLESGGADTYLYLRRGIGTSGEVLHKDDDYSGGGTNSQIRETLVAGSYTVEATTYEAEQTGSFTLTVGGLGSATAPADSCVVILGNDGTHDGEWIPGCRSENRSGSYARYYAFTLAEESEVSFTLESSDADTYLYLRDGEARSGDALHENDDHQGSTAVSQIQETLAAGTYTIEATTYDAGETGSFTLTFSGLGTAAGPTPSVPALWFDTGRDPFDDPRVRHAISYAIDQELINQLFWDGRGDLQSPVPDVLFPQWTTELDDPGVLQEWHLYDLEESRRLLAEAGWPDGLETRVHVLPRWIEWAEVVGSMLAEVGIVVDVVISAPAAIAELGQVSHRAMILAPLQRFGGDVAAFIREHFTEKGQHNYSRLASDVPEEILSEFVNTEETEKRRELVYYLQDYLHHEMVLVPLPAPPALPVATDPCIEPLAGLVTIIGDWEEDACSSEVPGRGYARYYSFTLAQESEVTITLERTSGEADTYLYLREGEARSGTVLYENDDYPYQGDTGKSRIRATLAAGSYTVEATTYDPGETGLFTLTVSGLGGAATATDSCVETLTGDGSESGQWAGGCESETVSKDGSGAYPHARYYTFTLGGESEVAITLESEDADTLLYLRAGDDTRSGGFLYENDDSPDTTRSQIRETLPAGSYTIEATTYYPGETGSFTLSVSGL